MKKITITFNVDEITELGTLLDDKRLKEVIKKEITQQFFPAILHKLKVEIGKSDIKEQ